MGPDARASESRYSKVMKTAVNSCWSLGEQSKQCSTLNHTIWMQPWILLITRGTAFTLTVSRFLPSHWCFFFFCLTANKWMTFFYFLSMTSLRLYSPILQHATQCGKHKKNKFFNLDSISRLNSKHLPFHLLYNWAILHCNYTDTMAWWRSLATFHYSGSMAFEWHVRA